MRKDRYYPGVSKFLDKRSKDKTLWRWRYRVRVKGKGMLLPGEYGDEEFVAAWHAYVNGQVRKVEAGYGKPGTIGELLDRYYTSREFAELREGTTQAVYKATLERLLRAKNADKSIRELTTEAIIGKRDKLTPNAANNFLRAIRHLCKFALERRLMKVDPTIGLRKFKAMKTKADMQATDVEDVLMDDDEDGIHTWTEEQVEQYAAYYNVLGSRERHPFDVARYTGQRRGDIVRLGRQHEVDGGAALRFRQEKTGTLIPRLPIIPQLRAAIDAANSGGITYLANAYGRPYSAAVLGNNFRKWRDAAGLPKICTLHGLRKYAATKLSDAGCTPHEIQAITGHRSLAQVELYTKRSNQKQHAKRVAPLLGGTRTTNEQNSGNVSGNASGNVLVLDHNALRRKENLK